MVQVWCEVYLKVLADVTLTHSDEIFSGSPYNKMHAVSVMIILHIMMMNRFSDESDLLTISL